MSAIIPASDASISRRAEKIPFATLHFTRNGRGGLVVLAELADGLTFWPSADRQTIVLDGGYLDHTAGLDRNLLDTNVINPSADSLFGSDPVEYFLDRTWELKDGGVITAHATAQMRCSETTEKVKLALTTLDLSRCQEDVTWSNGKTTRSEFWVALDTGRIWRASAQPWPGSDIFEWQVARPWW